VRYWEWMKYQRIPESFGRTRNNGIDSNTQRNVRERNVATEFKRIVMIPIKKKANAVECGDYRTLSLICHASKILLKVLNRRIENKAKDFIGENQFGFRKGRGTREAIGVLRTLCERSIERDQEVYIRFVDFEKAFDRGDWKIMMGILTNIGVDWRDRIMIMELYIEQDAVVTVADGETEPCIIGRGFRQGCPLSPQQLEDAMTGIDEGVKIGGILQKYIRFADDQAMVASTQEGL